MIDFHMHVLPSMDDGSRDVSVSLAMLEQSAAHGIDTVAATSHFYAEDNSPAQFLARRKKAYEQLARAMEGRTDLPRLLLGAEVRFFDGISAAEGLETLCLEGTNLLLLEMPFTRWTDRMLREVTAVGRRGIQPVAAHIERYIGLQSRDILRRFFGLEVLIQSNAAFFLSGRTGRRALRMLKNREIHFLGSDAHNLSSRAPDIGPALARIEKKLGEDALLHIRSYEELVREGSKAYL